MLTCVGRHHLAIFWVGLIVWYSHVEAKIGMSILKMVRSSDSGLRQSVHSCVAIIKNFSVQRHVIMLLCYTIILVMVLCYYDIMLLCYYVVILSC